MPSGVASITVTADGARSHYLHSDEGHILPGPDGKAVFTCYGKRPLIFEQWDALPRSKAVLPACSGSYYLELPQVNKNRIRRPFRLGRPPGPPPTPEPPAEKYSAAVRRSEEARRLATCNDLQLPEVGGEESIKHDFTFDKRVHLIPEARLVITIPGAGDRLVLRRYGG
jgi:hypothetical protein